MGISIRITLRISVARSKIKQKYFNWSRSYSSYTKGCISLKKQTHSLFTKSRISLKKNSPTRNRSKSSKIKRNSIMIISLLFANLLLSIALLFKLNQILPLISSLTQVQMNHSKQTVDHLRFKPKRISSINSKTFYLHRSLTAFIHLNNKMHKKGILLVILIANSQNKNQLVWVFQNKFFTIILEITIVVLKSMKLELVLGILMLREIKQEHL